MLATRRHIKVKRIYKFYSRKTITTYVSSFLLCLQAITTILSLDEEN
jgi:hypothetical protein